MSEQAIIMLSRLGIALLLLIAGGVATRIALNLVRKALYKSTLDEVLYSFILNCVKVVLWIVILATTLGYLGVPLSAFLAVIGSAGIAVALALKDSLANFAGGIIILIAKHFKKGDYIEDLSVAGEIQKIDLLFCTLKTPDNKIITIPNGKLANSTVVNYSRESERRVDLSFTVNFDNDIQRVKGILEAAAAGDERVLSEPAPIIGIAAMKDGIIDLDLKVWCRSEHYFDVKYALQEQVHAGFASADIAHMPPIGAFLK